MNTFWRRAAAPCFCLFLAGTTYAQTTTFVVHHNANLRADHSTQSAIKDYRDVFSGDVIEVT